MAKFIATYTKAVIMTVRREINADGLADASEAAQAYQRTHEKDLWDGAAELESSYGLNVRPASDSDSRTAPSENNNDEML